MEPLRTLRLQLEPLAPKHESALFSLYRDPLVRRHLLTRPLSRSDFRRTFDLALAASRCRGMWVVLGPNGPAPIGRVGFFAYSTARRPELAFLLGRRWWGQGYATEACIAAIRWASQRHKWPECVALVRPSNLGAGRVCFKLGMRPEESLRIAGGPVRLQRLDMPRGVGRQAA